MTRRRKPRVAAYSLAKLWGRKSYLRTVGWFESYRRREAVDASGQPLPLLVYPFLEFLEPRLDPSWQVFEFGSGYSTLWWAKRVRSLESVEHDPAWQARIQAELPANARLHLVSLSDGDAYPRRVLECGKKFDVIVVDGRRRVECARNAPGALADDGVIVWDDSDRERYQAGLEELGALGFRRLEFVGLHAGSASRKATSVLYRAANCLGI